MTRGGTRYVGSPSRFDHGFIGRWLIGRSRSSSRSSHRSDGWRWTLLTIVVHWIGGSRPSIKLKLHRTAENDRGRTPRSRPDRTAIADPLLWNQSHDRQMVSLENRNHDRRPIVARSRRKSWLFGSEIKARLTTKLERN